MEPETLKNQFVKLYNDESGSIYRFCLLRTSDKEVAVDIMQDTFMRAWDAVSKERGAWEEIRNKRAFLFTVARNCIIDWYRKKKPLSLESLAEESGVEIETFMDATAERDELEMEHEARFLVERIREIDAVYQQAVYFRFVEDLGPKEIAEILGKSENVVSVRINRGVKQLRKLAGYDEKEL